MMPRREIVNGLLVCSKCRQRRPVSWFAKDSSNPLALTYSCQECRKVAKPRKTLLLLPEPEIVDARDFPTFPDSPAKVERGRWERIVRLAAILERGQGLFIPFQGDYYRHHATDQALRSAARRLHTHAYVRHVAGGVCLRSERVRALGPGLMPHDAYANPLPA